MSLTISKTVPAGHSFVEEHQNLNSKLLVGVMLYMIKSCHRGSIDSALPSFNEVVEAIPIAQKNTSSF